MWCHTCWGNPAQQRIFRDIQSYQPTLEALNQVDADAITFETCSSGTGDLEAIGKIVTDKKVVIGVIDHHTLQVERPDQVADIIREALKHIPAERLVISSDCGMGREGMSRRHAQYKMVAMVLGTNLVRKELGLPRPSASPPIRAIRWRRRPPDNGAPGRRTRPTAKTGRRPMAQPARARSPAAAVSRLGYGFVAGFLATVVFHQLGLALLHMAGLARGGAYDMVGSRPSGCRR